jgi:hypothetical protein
VLAVTFETSVLKSHAAARLFCARLIGNNENLAENTRVRTEMSRLKHLTFSHCSTVQEHAKFDWTRTCPLACLSHFDTRWLQGTVLPGERGLLVLVFGTSQHSCGDE